MNVKLAETKEELLQILALQNANHFENIPAIEQQKTGFVTVKHTLDLLSKMNHKATQIIAVDNGIVIGYALVMLNEHKTLIPVLVPMFQSFEQINYNGKKLSQYSYYVMGQICIDKNYRGKGIFKELYQKHKAVYSNSFDLCITEVSTSNIRSMKAHENVGFKIIHTFKDKTDEWNILAWDWTNS